jgi:hypothetical protein
VIFIHPDKDAFSSVFSEIEEKALLIFMRGASSKHIPFRLAAGLSECS